MNLGRFPTAVKQRSRETKSKSEALRKEVANMTATLYHLMKYMDDAEPDIDYDM